MTVSLWTLAAYALQLAALVTVAFAAMWMLRIRIPRHSPFSSSNGPAICSLPDAAVARMCAMWPCWIFSASAFDWL